LTKKLSDTPGHFINIDLGVGFFLSIKNIIDFGGEMFGLMFIA